MVPHYTLQEVADMLGIGKAAVQYHIAQGRIRTVRKLLRVFITQDALDEFIQNRPTHSSPRNRMPDRADEGWYTVKQAAAILGIDSRGLNEHIRTGALPATHDGNGYRIAQGDLDYFAATRRKPGQPKRRQPRPCPGCQELFDAPDARQRFCSPECEIASKKAEYRQQHGLDDADQLRAWYVDQGLSAVTIAEMLGVNDKTVTNQLRAFGIPMRPGYYTGAPLPMPPRDDLARLILVECVGMTRAAAIYGVDPSTVGSWLDRYSIPRPQEGGYGRRIEANDGHIVQSSYELTVDNWLSALRIPHEYEPRLFGRFRADFYANGWYIEVWGVVNHDRYVRNKERKIAFYHDNRLPLIELIPQDFATDEWQHLLRRCLVSPG